MSVYAPAHPHTPCGCPRCGRVFRCWNNGILERSGQHPIMCSACRALLIYVVDATTRPVTLRVIERDD